MKLREEGKEIEFNKDANGLITTKEIEMERGFLQIL